MRRSASLGLVLSLTASISAMVGCSGNDSQAAVDVSSRCAVPLDSAPVRGTGELGVTIVEFADFQCPYCQRAEATLAELDELRPGLRWAFRNFPLTSLHQYAMLAASAADCAHQQGQFWEMHDTLFQEEGLSMTADSLTTYAEDLGLDMDAWSACFDSDESIVRVETDFDLGMTYGVEGTPTFFVNGYVLYGVYPTEDFLSVIDLAQQEAEASGLETSEYYETLVAQGCDG